MSKLGVVLGGAFFLLALAACGQQDTQQSSAHTEREKDSILAGSQIPGAKAVHAALWFWAGFSKLNHHFPSVVGVMTSNSPFTRFAWIRRIMYRDYPADLAPSLRLSRIRRWQAG